ncbi:NUDIX hydrolase [Micromonospora wenchangensis]|uniref:NUDIX hydrolase n=1 Tax=Micromonospora wenchangensis TaxID=1185415 RepID=A0A246RHP1_9ACTN|nr:NUDIX hydrolase [Micromonospora wenchangensis]OWV03803.1 NUDIX hydrolase [Micromonospora wenchangensis]
MQERRRIAAYGWCADEAGRVLLVRGRRAAGDPTGDPASDPAAGFWRLPGGVVRHAEHPADTVVRECAGRTGLAVAVAGIRAAVADLTAVDPADAAGPVHTDRLVFDVTVPGDLPLAGGAPPSGACGGDGPGELAWCTPQEAATLPLVPFTAELLGLPVPPPPAGPPSGVPVEPAVPESADRRQRFAAYGLVTDPDGRVLLTMIAPGYPGAGLWHLPGGGTDHGEQPVDGLLRELVEETGQRGRVDRLILADNLHNPGAVGPEGRPLDWHGVRVIYRVLVDEPTGPVVTEQAGGSTASAAWFTYSQLSGLAMTDVAVLATGWAVG